VYGIYPSSTLTSPDASERDRRFRSGSAKVLLNQQCLLTEWSAGSISICAPSEQRSYYEDLLDRFPFLQFPRQTTHDYRFFTDNGWFVLSDAFTLSGVIRKEKPRRIVEVGSGFSSAVILDTLSHTHESATLTFIEPFPDRLHGCFRPTTNLARRY
jgi:hypothetical protein